MFEALTEYGEGREPVPAIDEPTLVLSINTSLRRDVWTDEDVYKATRYSWRVSAETRDRAVYALGVSRGVVRGAYRIDRWLPANDGRWCFDGRPATELDVVGTSVARIKAPRGSSNPVRKFLDGIPAPAPNDQA